MKFFYWNRLGFRILIGWLICCTMPMMIFWQYFPKDASIINLVNSWIATSIGIIIILVILERFNRLSEQDSMLVVIPVYSVILGIIASILFIFRIPYSVLYLLASLPLELIFCFFLEAILKNLSKSCLGYIPVGRYRELLDIDNVTWVSLENKPFPIKGNMTFSAVIVDLSDENLYGEWENYLGKLTIHGIPVYNILQAKESLTGRLPIRHLYENNLGSMLPQTEMIAIKRFLDTCLILIFSPLILIIILIVSLCIYCEDRYSNSPIFFSQYRVGQGGKVFKMYKFRSMYVNDPNQNKLMTQANDSRITKVGKVIRKLRIDELPQFYNVLKGDMSLIGPRPELPSEVERLENEIPFYIYRQIVKPGISGWAQVMQGEGHVENIQTKLEYDFYYIKNFSFTLDFLIVIKTIQTMLTGFGAR